MISGIEASKGDATEISIKVLKCILGRSSMPFRIHKSRKPCGDPYIAERVFPIPNLPWSDLSSSDLTEIYYNLAESYFDDTSKHSNFATCCKT